MVEAGKANVAHLCARLPLMPDYRYVPMPAHYKAYSTPGGVKR